MPYQECAYLASFLTSALFAIQVGPESNRRTFHLHSALLTKESHRLSVSIKNDGKEAAKRTIELDEEDPDLFGCFVAYLYCSSGAWLLHSQAAPTSTSSNTFCNRCGTHSGTTTKHPTDYTILARLYALGDRLQALTFQQTVLADFMTAFNSNLSLPDQEICNLLEVATTELPELVREDPLRDQVFWFDACRLDSFQKCPRFQYMLDNLPDMGKHLCERAGKSAAAQPPRNSTSESLGKRFKKERIVED